MQVPLHRSGNLVLSIVSPCFLPIPSFWAQVPHVWCLAQSIRICSNRHKSIQQFGMTFTVTSKPKSVRLSHGILTRQSLSHPAHCTTWAHHSKIISVNSTTTPIFTSVEQCRIRNSNFVASFFKCGLHLLYEIRTSISEANPLHLRLLAVCLPVDRKWALLMSKMTISSSFPFCARNIISDKKSQQHFEDFPWGHCTEEYAQARFTLSSRATLSPQVCNSLLVCLRLLYLLLPTWWVQLRCLCALLLLYWFSGRVQSLSPNEFLPYSCVYKISWKLCICVIVEFIRPLRGCLTFEVEDRFARRWTCKLQLHPTIIQHLLSKSSKCCVHKLGCIGRSHFGLSSIQHDVSVKWRFVAVWASLAQSFSQCLRVCHPLGWFVHKPVDISRTVRRFDLRLKTTHWWWCSENSFPLLQWDHARVKPWWCFQGMFMQKVTTSTPILGTNSHFEIGKRCTRWWSCQDLWSFKSDHLEEFFHVAVLAEISTLTFMWSIQFVHAQNNCKTRSQTQISSLGCETVWCDSLDDLCSALRQQRSNFVNQSVTRFYLLVSEEVVGTVSGQSLKFSLVCSETHSLYFSDLTFHFQVTDLHVLDGVSRVMRYIWWYHDSLLCRRGADTVSVAPLNR